MSQHLLISITAEYIWNLTLLLFVHSHAHPRDIVPSLVCSCAVRSECVKLVYRSDVNFPVRNLFPDYSDTTRTLFQQVQSSRSKSTSLSFPPMHVYIYRGTSSSSWQYNLCTALEKKTNPAQLKAPIKFLQTSSAEYKKCFVWKNNCTVGPQEQYLPHYLLQYIFLTVSAQAHTVLSCFEKYVFLMLRGNQRSHFKFKSSEKFFKSHMARWMWAVCPLNFIYLAIQVLSSNECSSVLAVTLTIFNICTGIRW